jgi:gamma-glutamyltranspeptidase
MMQRSHRPLIMGYRGAVASNHPLATLAGLDVLRAGGNAADAAVAVAFAIGVVEPHMSGIGGDGFYHLYLAGENRRLVVNAGGPAPMACKPDRYSGGIPNTGPGSISTPGMLGGLQLLHSQHGVMPWGRLLQPAIDAAESGFGATHSYRRYAAQERARLLACPRAASRFLGSDGVVPAIATQIVQPELASTLKSIAREGAEAFYQGHLAKLIAGAVEASGGYLAVEDLRVYRPEVQEPIAITYRGFDIFQTPPNTTGFVLLQMLKLVEQVDPVDHAPLSADAVHLMVEAKKLAFADRERFGCDPQTAPAPLDRLLSDDYARRSLLQIDPGRAAMPKQFGARNGDTTYFCTVDEDGNAVSGIQSINSPFGSGFVAGGTGVLLNNRMTYWHLDRGHPNELTPGRRVRHTMNAPMVFRNGRLWAVLGTPGGDNQVQVNLQVIRALIDFDLDPQQAVEMPRWSSSQPGQAANYPHGGDHSLTMEAGFPEETYRTLSERGHVIDRLAALEGPCSVSVIRVDEQSGARIAGSDPRRDAWALAY